MSNLDKYNNIFQEVFSVAKENLNADFTILSVEKWDSVAHMELISKIEDEFGIMLDTNDIIDFSSYIKGISILTKYSVDIEEN